MCVGCATVDYSLVPILPRYFRIVAQYLGRTPAMRAQLLEGTGIEPRHLESRTLEVTLAQQLIQHENIDRMFGRDWLLRHIGPWRRLIHNSVAAEYYVCETLEDVIHLKGARKPILAGVYEINVNIGSDHTFLYLDNSNGISDAHFERFLEIWATTCLDVLELYACEAAREIHVNFALSSYGNLELFKATSACEFSLGRGRSFIRFPSAWLAKRSPLYDPIAWRQLRVRRELEFETFAGQPPLELRIALLLMQSEHGTLKLKDVASALATSERSLARRLSERGVRFRDLLAQEHRRREVERDGLLSLQHEPG